MTEKIQPWMFAAAREWMKRSTGVNRDSYDSQQLAEVIASHAPSEPDHWLSKADELIAIGNRLRDLLLESEAAAQPTCTCGADRTGPTAESHAVDCPAEIEHNDH